MLILFQNELSIQDLLGRPVMAPVRAQSIQVTINMPCYRQRLTNISMHPVKRPQRLVR